jgi:hypothetical protein
MVDGANIICLVVMDSGTIHQIQWMAQEWKEDGWVDLIIQTHKLHQLLVITAN